MHHKRKNCRLCSSASVEKIFPMPKCPPVDNYRFEHEDEINLPAFPMDLYMCQVCGHAQLLDVVAPEILFGKYIYTSSSSPDLDRHFTNYANKIIEYADLDHQSLVIDIGSNDGLLLSKFKSFGITVQGIDPARSVAENAIKSGIPTIISFLSPDVVVKIHQSIGLADVVCANNVFSHSDNLREFANCVRSLLKPNGIFVFEVSYLQDLVENKVVDYIYHEHLAHHSIQPLNLFFKSINMRLFDVERISTKGGSIRCYSCLDNARWKSQPIISDMIEEEHRMKLYQKETYETLYSFFSLVKEQIESLFNPVIARNSKIAAYGASATTTVLNEMLDLNKYISFIVDDNPIRQFRLNPRHKILVKSSSALMEEQPEYTFISAWRFADLIVSRNQDYLENGGKFVVPLPKFKIITELAQ